MTRHWIFFDHTCLLCQKSVDQIKKRDKKSLFTFFPLESSIAKQHLSKELLKADTLVLMEDQKKIWVRARAVFRILKLLQGKWSWLGFLCYVPGIDLFYKIVAHHRHMFTRFFS